METCLHCQSIPSYKHITNRSRTKPEDSWSGQEVCVKRDGCTADTLHTQATCEDRPLVLFSCILSASNSITVLCYSCEKAPNFELKYLSFPLGGLKSKARFPMDFSSSLFWWLQLKSGRKPRKPIIYHIHNRNR